MNRVSTLLLFVFAVIAECQEGRSGLSRRVGVRGGGASPDTEVAGDRRLRFGNKSGEFKILQVADMHYADGKETRCLDVFPDQIPTCSDLNTTAFIRRVIRDENPDFIVFTGKVIVEVGECFWSSCFSHRVSPRELGGSEVRTSLINPLIRQGDLPNRMWRIHSVVGLPTTYSDD